MGTELIVGFNGGEVSRNIESRVDLPLYKRSCSVLENFDVLPEGGVRNRAGTKFISKTKGTSAAGDETAHLLDFSYSDDYSYIFEFGEQYLRIYNNQTEAVVADLVTSYAIADVKDIQFERSYDIMWLVHPDYPEQTISRTSTTSFTIADTTYDFPPMGEQNDTATTITPSARTGTGVTLTASTAIFEADHVGSHWLLKQKRLGTNIIGGIEYGSAINNTATTIPASDSGWFYVSSSHYRIETDNTWQGRIAVEQTLDGGTTVEEVVLLGDTTAPSTAANHIYESVNRAPVGASIRLVWTGVTGNLDINISTKDSYIYGLAKITGYTSSTVVTADILGDLYDTGAVTLWSEGAFSGVNGYPRTVVLFEERKWYSGTKGEPNMVWGSVTDDFYNYFVGTLDDEAIMRAPPVNGFSSWLIAKDNLFLCTTNEIVQISGLVSSQGLTPENFKFSVQSSDGSDYQQSEIANDTIIYVQKGRNKLRELIYSYDSNGFITNDLSALAKHITKKGINTTSLQKLPDQRVLCVLDNGELAPLTYERLEEVVAWQRYVTDGTYESCAVTLDGDEDSIWYVIKRDGEYFVEKQQSREYEGVDEKYWFLDSAVEFDGGSTQTATSITVGASPDYKIIITKAGHNLSDGNKIMMKNVTGFDEINNRIFTVDYIDANSFYLNDIDDNVFNAENSGFPNYIDATGSGVSYMDGRYSRSHLQYGNKDTYRLTDDLYLRYNSYWTFRDAIEATGKNAYINPLDQVDAPPLTGYTIIKGGYSPAPTMSYPTITGDFCLVRNSISGLDHLEGKTIGAIADDKYQGEFVVSSGAITLDEYFNYIVAGLPYTSTVSPLPIEFIGQYGASSGHMKTLSSINVKLKDSIGGLVGTDLDNMESMDLRLISDPIGEQLDPFNDDTQVYPMDAWDDIKRVYIQQTLPLPLEVLSVSMNMATKGR